MTATLDAAPTSVRDDKPGDPTTAAGHPSEAFLIACVLAEHANSMLGPDAPSAYVRNILRSHLQPDTRHSYVLAWRERSSGSELVWRYQWNRACATVRIHFPDLVKKCAPLADYDATAEAGLYELS